jgi:hypothetical protein
MITETAVSSIAPTGTRLSGGPLYMYLAYMDDTGTGNKVERFQVMTAVIVADGFFHAAQSRAIGGLAAYIPEDKADEFWQKFEEFKGWQLFGGYGPFDGINQETRFGIIEYLLNLVSEFKMPIVYGAVEKEKLRKKSYGSALPLDMCFRICMDGIAEEMQRDFRHDFALLVADNSNADAKRLRESFYEFRRGMKREGREPFPTPHLHDDMYFGDSKYSIGIQLADLCGYFISKHLEGNPAGEGFYNLIKDRIVYSRVEP